jgi:predicted HAD superfamily phosphohydrolase
MAHLVNTLYAYDAEITAVMQNESPSREVFQAKFATLMNLPQSERKEQATIIFNEYNIPEAEREEWLNPLMEV